jgi:quercetin dioxygenase-like cupin family protein
MAKKLAFALQDHPVHLGLGARVTVQERFTGNMDWYEAYARRNAADGVEGRLVSLHSFGTWDAWEMHPRGEELVVCVAGRITLVQEERGKRRRVTLEKGEAAINPAGVWHTVDVKGRATALFVTAGEGTEHRPRKTRATKRG